MRVSRLNIIHLFFEFLKRTNIDLEQYPQINNLKILFWLILEAKIVAIAHLTTFEIPNSKVTPQKLFQTPRINLSYYSPSY